MERRNFFKTLGATLAGAVILKPDFSKAEEIQESIPVQIWDDSGVKYLFPKNVKCGLYHKNVLLVDGKFIEDYSMEREVQLIQYGDNGDRFAVAYPKKEQAIIYGNLIADEVLFYKIFNEDTPCTLVITQNEMQITADVIIMECPIDIDVNVCRRVKLELAFVSEATVTPL